MKKALIRLAALTSLHSLSQSPTGGFRVGNTQGEHQAQGTETEGREEGVVPGVTLNN